MTPDLSFLAIEAAVLVARALAIVAGVLVCLDSAKVVTGIEHPTHNPQGNALAWATIAAGAIIGAIAFIYGGKITYGRMDNPASIYAVFFIWMALSAGLVWRAAIRSLRPRMIWGSALIFGVAGFGLTMGEALGGADMIRGWVG